LKLRPFVSEPVMSQHVAVVEWNRGDQPFSDNKYGRGHDWRFDGGAVVRGSSAPSPMIPPPSSEEAAVEEKPAAKPASFRTASPAPAPVLAEPAPAPDAAITSAREIAPRAASLQESRASSERFDGCASKSTATRSVFA
ncbi:hypothetical protein OY671_011246, partial [Metschnikowia pulcherrima]